MIWLYVGLVLLVIIILYVPVLLFGPLGLVRWLVEKDPLVTSRLVLWLADFDANWCRFRSLPPEGEMFIMVRGGPDGPYDHVIESVSDHLFDRETDTFIPLKKEGEEDESEEDKTIRERYEEEEREKQNDPLTQLGVTVVGFNKRLLCRELKYHKWEELEDSKEERERGEEKMGLVQKIRPGPNIYFVYLMGTQADNAETKGNIPVDAIVSFKVLILGPRIAFFLTGGWVLRVLTDIQGVLRSYISQLTVDELREENARRRDTGEMVQQILDLNDNGPDGGLIKAAGIKITHVTFVRYEPSRDDVASRALQARERARLEGQAAIVTAKAEARAEQIRAEGDRQAAILRAEGKEAEFEVRRRLDPTGTFSLSEAVRDGNAQAISIGGGQPAALPVLPLKKDDKEETKDEKEGKDK